MQNVPTPPNIYSRKVIYWKCVRKGRMPKHYAKFGFFLLPRNYLVVWAIVIRNECFMILLINYDQYIYKVSKKNTSFSFELHVNIEQLITQINKEKNSYSAFTIFARHQHIRLPLTFFTKHQWKTTTSSCFIFLKTIFKNNLTCYSNM